MKRLVYLSLSFVVGSTLWGCSSTDEDAILDDHPWSVSSIATKDSGEVMTRALFIGGVTGKRYVSIWESSDVVQVCNKGSITPIGTMTPVTQDVATTELKGSLTGTFNVGDELDFYLPGLDLDYTGQTGLLKDMSKYAHMSSSVKINRIEGGVVYTDNIKFTAKECYMRIRFVDEDGVRLPVEQLTISAASGQILLQKPISGTAVYGDLVINTAKEHGAYPSEVYVSLHNDLNNTDTYSFTVKSNGYYYGGVSGNMTYKLVDTKYYLTTRTLTMQGSASRIGSQLNTTIIPHTDGGGDNNGSVAF